MNRLDFLAGGRARFDPQDPRIALQGKRPIQERLHARLALGVAGRSEVIQKDRIGDETGHFLNSTMAVPIRRGISLFDPGGCLMSSSGSRPALPTVTLERPVSGRGPQSVPTNLLRTIPPRFGALTIAVAVSLGIIGALIPGFPTDTPIEAGIAALVLLTCAAAFFAARSPKFSREQLLDLGLAFQWIVCTAMAALDATTRNPVAVPSLTSLILNVFLVAIPLALPSPPSKLVPICALCALMHPLTLLLATPVGKSIALLPEIGLATLPTIMFAALGVFAGTSLYRARRSLSEARELGRYELVELLGRGGMGEVWRARHRMLARPAAIKFVRPETLGHTGTGAIEELRSQFEREAKITSSLTSPHTIEIYDFGVTEEGSLCYVMEHLDGMDLESLVREYGPLSASRAIYLLRQVCISLAEAHQAGLIHRDIKPANIYVTRKGVQHDFVKVLDFGLVAEVDPAGAADSLANGGTSILGTPAYMAPEVASGKKADARADLYSLGCVAYWLVTGHQVFESEILAEVIAHQIRTRPEPPSQRTNKPIPRDLELVILGCLQKRPEDRIGSAAALSRKLAECDVRPVWTPGQAMKWWSASPERPTHEPAPEKTLHLVG